MKVAKAPNYNNGEKQPIAKVFILYKGLFQSVQLRNVLLAYIYNFYVGAT